MKTKIFIAAHQGLGDHLVCASLYFQIAQKYDLCIIPVKPEYYATVQQLVGAHPNIILDRLFARFPWEQIRHKIKLYSFFGIESIKLGYFGTNFLVDKSMLLDTNFYLQAKLSPAARWEFFDYQRNLQDEEDVFRILKCNEQPYLFLHEDKYRGFSIDRKYLNQKYRIIEPNLDQDTFNILSYRKVLENASEIHCIESSFSVLIDNLGIEAVPKFAHRYSRPEVLNDPRHAITFRTDWQILTGEILSN